MVRYGMSIFHRKKTERANHVYRHFFQNNSFETRKSRGGVPNIVKNPMNGNFLLCVQIMFCSLIWKFLINVKKRRIFEILFCYKIVLLCINQRCQRLLLRKGVGGTGVAANQPKIESN